MDPALEQLVVDRLAASDMNAAAADLVLAACGGPGELELALEGDPSARTTASAQLALTADAPGVYLKSIEVEGFRGVGAPVTLALEPGPGLTIVAGRNGSGKSSFAEGLELLMTGTNSRWTDRTKVWLEGWQNLHHSGPTVVAAELAVDGERGAARLRREWPADAELGDDACTVRRGDGSSTSLDEIGWTLGLSRFRPFLSFNELGQMFDKPSRMYDALSAILGLEDVEALGLTLRDARLARQKIVKTTGADTDALRTALTGIDDERATIILNALDAKPADLDGIELALEGMTLEAGGDLGVLRSITALEIPDAAAVDLVVGALEQARSAVATLRDTDAGRAASLARVLEAALAHDEHHAGADCPVCGTANALRTGWQADAVKEVTRLTQEARAVEDAERAEAAARRRVAELLPVTPPPSFAAARDLGLDPGAVEHAWDRWAQERDTLEDPSSLARLRETVALLRRETEALTGAARAELDRREDAWRPVGTRVVAWLPGARAAEAAQAVLKPIKTAEKWATDTAGDLRAARIAPIADAAIENWKLLRHESNVTLEGFRLTRSGTSRVAHVDVRVDGSDASAFGVMSQGELHALAVSVFLPRAGLAESPFRFMVIDDPVQSMDPAKVDGLARVLDGAARDRQVVVFTHDERLPEAIRRLGLSATVLEVTRRPGSLVEIRKGLDPIERYLADARALVRSDAPKAVVDRVVPGFCRHAIEAACALVVRRRRLLRGESHAAVEETLRDATTLYKRLALALFDDPERTNDVLSHINNKYGSKYADAVRGANKGVHELLAADMPDFVRDAGQFARALPEHA